MKSVKSKRKIQSGNSDSHSERGHGKEKVGRFHKSERNRKSSVRVCLLEISEATPIKSYLEELKKDSSKRPQSYTTVLGN